MEHAISLFFRSIFVDNMIFAYFLGMCSYLAGSKNVPTSLGLGLAVTFVLLITVPVDYLLQTKVLSADGILGVDLTYLSFILFIAVDADNNTIYGVYFNHEGETAGLGAEIKDNLKWQQKFQGKKIHKDGVEGIALGVEKDAPAGDPNNVDAVTGATLTSDGVDAMLKEGLAKFIK